MKEVWQKLVRSRGFWLGLVILVQTVVYLLAGAGKAYIHMDEAYSLALAQYDKIDITENADFYNTWHTSEYFQDYLAVQEKDRGDFWPVYENQKNDVHPPLYYVLLRGVMELAPGKFSKWPGIVLNIVIMAGCTGLLYLLVCRLLAKEKYAWQKALVVTLVAGLTVAGVSAVVYIRMYMLLTLMVYLTLWLHLKLREQEQPKAIWYVWLCGAAVLGVLTQYYYLFFLFGLVLVMVIDYVRQKKWAELVKYLGSLALAGGLVLLVWPHILQHMFFGYRGQGALSNLGNLPVLFQHLLSYFWIVDYNVFHRTLPVLLAVGVLSCFLAAFATNGERAERRLARRNESRRSPSEGRAGSSFRGDTRESERSEDGPSQVPMKRQLSTRAVRSMFMLPALMYFVLAAVASPFMELRYIMPVCGLIFVLVMYGLYRVFKDVLAEKWRNVVMLVTMLVVLLAAPVQLGMGWMRVELLYRDRQAVMTAVRENSEAPLLYFITTENNRFLDNILPFAEAQESYLALDLLEPTVAEVQEILQGKNLEHGLFVFVSGSQEQEKALEAVVEATGLDNVEFVQGINTCDVYYLSKL